MAKTKSQEEILDIIYDTYCRMNMRRNVFDKNVNNDPEYIKKLTGMDINTFEKVLNVYETYVPANISLALFLTMLEDDPKLLDDIKGNFSSFNPELSKKFQQYKAHKITSDQFRNDARGAIDIGARIGVAKKYADIYTSIIAGDDEILRDAWIFDTLDRKQRQELAIKIIDGINKHLGIEQKLKIRYTDGQKRFMTTQTLLQELFGEFIEKVILRTEATKPTGLYNGQEKSIHIIKSESFSQFINTLSHEYGHFIDDNYPNLGMLGAQIAEYGRQVYYRTGAQHHKNATERASMDIAEAVRQQVLLFLHKQQETKPDLYKKALTKAITNLELKLAAMRLKLTKKASAHTEESDEYTKIKNKLAFYKVKLNQLDQSKTLGGGAQQAER